MRKKIFEFVVVISITIIVCLIAGSVLGILLAKNSDIVESVSFILFIFMLVATLIIGYFVHILFHELGHLIFGLYSKYQFISLRLGKILFLKINKKYKMVVTHNSIISGQCIMAPLTLEPNHYPFVLYNLGGVIVNFILIIINLALYMLISTNIFFSLLEIMMIVVGICMFFFNIIPMGSNDGHNLYILLKNKYARYAFWSQLNVYALSIKGIRLKDMPEEYFLFDINQDLKDLLICTQAYQVCSYYLDKHDFDIMRKIAMKVIDTEGVPEVFRNELQCEVLYVELVTDCRKDVIDKLYTLKLSQYIERTKKHISKQRLLYAYERLFLVDDELANDRLEKFNSQAKLNPYPIEVESEKKLMYLIDQQYNGLLLLKCKQ